MTHSWDSDILNEKKNVRNIVGLLFENSINVGCDMNTEDCGKR